MLSVKLKHIYFCLALLSSVRLFAHPMPSSMVVLKVHEKSISGEIQLPLGELQSAIGMSVNDHSEHLVERLGDTLHYYLLSHIRPRSFDGKAWKVILGTMYVTEEKTNRATGDYRELIVNFTMTPPAHYDLRNFYFDYDVILHQVASHQILVNVKEDWERGIVSEDATLQQIGVIALDVPTGKIPVFQVSLQQGSTWQGFKNMVVLGIEHIAEGTDHILFIFTLLLPAMLMANGTKWGNYKGLKPSLWTLLSIVTAFTVGHSATLILGATEWVNISVKPIEVCIALTILISAIHAFRPIYPQKEVLIAGGFGLIHGMAFAETLLNLDLSVKQMILSILGFNIGIELMQLGIILVAFPVLLLLSQTRYYTIFRQASAILMIMLAILWMAQRIGE